MVEKIEPNDKRVTTERVKVPTSGHTYTYLLAKPEDQNTIGTAVLLHGFPDLAFGWRNQILFLRDLGYKVVVPNMLGYAGTDAPTDPKEYTYKNISRDIYELILSTGLNASAGEQIILGGHDWGGALTWRLAMWYPSLIKGLFAVCAPFSPPSAQKKFKHPGEILPNFGYQLQFAGDEVENGVKSAEDVRKFLNGMYGWGGKEGVRLMAVEKGFDISRMKQVDVGTSPIVTENEMDHYVSEYMKHEKNPMHGPLNWYRVHELNFNDEKEAGWGNQWREGKTKFEFPTLAIVGKKDAALPPAMSEGMENWFAKGNVKGGLTRTIVEANHWALWTNADEVNGLVANWLETEFDVKRTQRLSSPRL